MSKQDAPVARMCSSPMTRQALTADESADLARAFKAIGDPVRLRLLSLIAAHQGGEACVCDLTDAFEVSGPTISHHLKVLREAGVISGDRRGTWVYYRVVPEVLTMLARVLVPADADTQSGQAVASARRIETLPVVPA